MSTLKQLRLRINSISLIQKLTKTMRLTASAKLYGSIREVATFDYFQHTTAAALNTLLDNMNPDNISDPVTRAYLGLSNNFANNEVLKIIIGSDQGLCGGFNSTLVKTALNLPKVQGPIITVGKKIYNNLKHKCKIYKNYQIAKQQNLDVAYPLQQDIINLIQEGRINRCIIIFSKFKNILIQQPTEFQLFPLGLTVQDCGNSSFEGGEQTVGELLNMSILAKIANIFAISKASEQAARMQAMDSANKNAFKLQQDLSLVMHKQRQDLITREISEIISGANI